jgi:hypothetical protein
MCDNNNRVSAAGRSKKVRTEDNVTKDATEELDIETQALKLAEELAERIQAIESDPSIPVRAKKSKGEKCERRHHYRYHSHIAKILTYNSVHFPLHSQKRQKRGRTCSHREQAEKPSY